MKVNGYIHHTSILPLEPEPSKSVENDEIILRFVVLFLTRLAAAGY